MRPRVVAAGLAALMVWTTPLASQVPVTRNCDSALAAPSKDTIVLHALLQMHAFDRSHDVPEWYQEEFAEGIRTFLHVPTPLGIETYEGDRQRPPRTAHLAVRAAFRATLTRDGRILDAHATGGAHNRRLDDAVIAAMRALDSSGMLKASSPAALPEDETLVFVYLTTGDDGGPSRTRELSGVLVTTIGRRGKLEQAAVGARSDSGLSTPLFAFRTPVRDITRPSGHIPGYGTLRYPDNLRREGISGEALMSFVIRTNGTAEAESFIALRADRMEFAQSVLNAGPSFRFHPLEVESCVVREIVQTPFTFKLNP